MTHDPARCVGCGRCAEECFGRAIVLVGRRMSVEAVMTEVLADTEFYERSSGGMTISGGEPLVQPDFTGALLNAARASGIATAVETNLGWPWPTVERILPATDLIMADLKVLNDEVHRRETGMSNERVLANFERLARAGVPVIARTPLIAGINDRPSEVAAMADFLAPLGNITCWELLPYHPLGEGKRSSLGLPTAEKPLHPPTSERLEQLIQAARRLGLPVKVATALGSTSAAEPASGCCCDDKVRKR
jgi:pyruvate formate lyase activating enzyme